MPINGRAYKRQFTVWEVMEGGEGGGGGGEASASPAPEDKNNPGLVGLKL